MRKRAEHAESPRIVHFLGFPEEMDTVGLEAGALHDVESTSGSLAAGLGNQARDLPIPASPATNTMG